MRRRKGAARWLLFLGALSASLVATACATDADWPSDEQLSHERRAPPGTRYIPPTRSYVDRQIDASSGHQAEP